MEKIKIIEIDCQERKKKQICLFNSFKNFTFFLLNFIYHQDRNTAYHFLYLDWLIFFLKQKEEISTIKFYQ